MSATPVHPREALFGHEAARPALPVVDHYCGVEARMRKSLALQAELGPVFDITLDAEDGAPVGGEAEHAQLIAELVTSAANRFGRVGARMMLGREPWLPRSILHRRLSTARSHQLLTGAIKLARMLESFVRPRLDFLHAGPIMPRVTGLGIVIASLGLMLPLPIPFSNSIPAWAVVLLAIGMMEKDGLCVLLGYLTVVATWVFIGLTSMFAIGGIQALLHSF